MPLFLPGPGPLVQPSEQGFVTPVAAVPVVVTSKNLSALGVG